MAAPAINNTAMSTAFVSAWRIPNTTKNMPTDDSSAPIASKGRVGSGASGSTTRRRLRTMMTTMTRREQEQRDRQRPDAIEGEASDEASLAPPPIGQLAARDHETAIACTPVTVVSSHA